MKIKSQQPNTLELGGKPGGAVWMALAVLIGAGISVATVWFGSFLWNESDSGWDGAMIPMGVGLLIGQALFWTGAVTLVKGKLLLTMDLVTGRGEYQVDSPIVDAGKPCKFFLKNVRSVEITSHEESRSGGGGAGNVGHNATEATVYRAVLRIAKPRRSITLDETENGRYERVDGIAQAVAEFLGTTVERSAEQRT